jgi:hypothetical protein
MSINVDIVRMDALHFYYFAVVQRNTANILMLFRCSDLLMREMPRRSPACWLFFGSK